MLPVQRGITMSTSIEPLMFQHFIHLNWIYVKCTGSERDFVSIYDLDLNRSSNYTVKQFAGNVLLRYRMLTLSIG